MKNKLINKYKELRNKIILEERKKQFSKKENNSYQYLDMLHNSIGIYNEFIDKDTHVIVGRGIKNSFYFKTGNLDEAYLSLMNKVKVNTNCTLNINSEEELLNILNKIYATIIEYFGYGNVEDRIKHYESNWSQNITLESLKGKNLAVCLEDAVLAQNMLKLLGFNSTLKVSLIQLENGKYDRHAYNLISYKNKHYIFDSRFPSPSGPITSILTDKEYFKLIYGSNENEKITNTNNGCIYFTNNISLKQANQISNKSK